MNSISDWYLFCKPFETPLKLQNRAATCENIIYQEKVDLRNKAHCCLLETSDSTNICLIVYPSCGESESGWTVSRANVMGTNSLGSCIALIASIFYRLFKYLLSTQLSRLNICPLMYALIYESCFLASIILTDRNSCLNLEKRKMRGKMLL